MLEKWEALQRTHGPCNGPKLDPEGRKKQGKDESESELLGVEGGLKGATLEVRRPGRWSREISGKRDHDEAGQGQQWRQE